MKRLLFVFLTLSSIFPACTSSDARRSENDQPMELGWVNRSALFAPAYQPFVERFDTVQTAPEFVALMRTAQQGIDVLIFFGTWCGDSKREVPHFFKIADEIGIDSSRIKLYGVDRSKKSADGLTGQYGIERVPTFIFMKQGNEVGRITEKPQATLEADMLTILAAAQAK